MNPDSTSFDLNATLAAVQQAFLAIVCHAIFLAGLHGLAIGTFLLLLGFILHKRRHRLGRPFTQVAKRVFIICAVMITPGLICLGLTHALPPVGLFNVNSIGFLGFWSLVVLFLCAEQGNYDWFVKGPAPVESLVEEVEEQNLKPEIQQDLQEVR